MISEADILAECQRVYEYPSDGRLIRKVAAGRGKLGAEATHRCSEGYLRAGLLGRQYHAHRLVFLMVHGWMPREIDHINGDRTDNRPANLRPATRTLNNGNQRLRSTNTSGKKGVSWDPVNRRWRAQLRFAGRSVNVGRFATIGAAAEAYDRAAVKCFGAYARTNSDLGLSLSE